MDTRRREREDPSCDQGSPGRHLAQPEQGIARRSPRNGVRGPRQLYAISRRVYDRPNDANNTTYATWLFAGLRAQKSREYRLESVAELVYTDSQGMLNLPMLRSCQLFGVRR